MRNVLAILALCFVLLALASPAMAQQPAPAGEPAATTVAGPTTLIPPLVYITGGAAAGIIIIGASMGISRIGSSAVESMARQPEAAGSIQTAMIISAALIEGATFFALIVAMLFNR